MLQVLKCPSVTKNTFMLLLKVWTMYEAKIININ